VGVKPQLITSPPIPHATEVHSWVLHTGTELRDLRQALRDALTNFAVPVGEQGLDISEKLTLVATELATNAIKHGRPPSEVRLLHTGDQFILDVADHDLSSVPQLAHTRPLDAGGRGLFLALAMSLQVGWYATERTKHIWAAFPAGPPAAAGS
jgi:serine/threonine-protein kinase RsbW